MACSVTKLFGDANDRECGAFEVNGSCQYNPEDTIKDPYVFEFLGIPEDKPILCTDKDDITAEYALGGLSNQIFAAKYVLHMPNKEQLIAQVEDVINKWNIYIK